MNPDELKSALEKIHQDRADGEMQGDADSDSGSSCSSQDFDMGTSRTSTFVSVISVHPEGPLWGPQTFDASTRASSCVSLNVPGTHPSQGMVLTCTDAATPAEVPGSPRKPLSKRNSKDSPHPQRR